MRAVLVVAMCAAVDRARGRRCTAGHDRRRRGGARRVRVVRGQARLLRSEITVRAIAKSGAALPNLEVNLPGVHGIAAPLDPTYLDAVLTVVDLSPFPRMCEYEGGCVMTEAAAAP